MTIRLVTQPEQARVDDQRSRNASGHAGAKPTPSLLLLQRQAGNRAVADLVARSRRLTPSEDVRVPIQRRVDVAYAPNPGGGWQRPAISGAGVVAIQAFLAHADNDLGDNRNRVAIVTNPAVMQGALWLSRLPGGMVTVSYQYAGTAAEPDRLVRDLQRWGQFASAPPTFQDFLVTVWNNARGFAPNDMADAIYDLYGGQPAGHPVVPNPTDNTVFQRLAAAAAGPFGGWNIWSQGDYFVHFESPAWGRLTGAEQGRSQRFYFNPGPDYPSALRAFLNMLRDVVTTFGGKGKIIGPSQYGARSDCIIIWIPSQSAGAAEGVLAQNTLAAYGATSGGAVPPMLRQVLAGDPSMGTGEEPGGGGTQSFGTYRAALLAEALDGAATFEQFLATAVIAFRVAQVPWNAPERGGTTNTVLNRVVRRRH